MAVHLRTRFLGFVLIATLFVLLLSSRQCKDGHGLSLNVGHRIYIFANSIRPSGPTCESYPYFDFPFCPPGEHVMNRTKSLDKILSRDCYTNTLYNLRFKKDSGKPKIHCKKNLTASEVAKFRYAIARKFKYEFVSQYGSLLGDVGTIEEDKDHKPRYYLWLHTTFYIRYYKDQIIDMSIYASPDVRVDITTDDKLDVLFTYSVLWDQVTIHEFHELSERVTENVRRSFGIQRWSMFLIWLTVMSIVTLPYLLTYLTCYRGLNQYIHGEHCNCPQYTALLGAILGNGCRLLIMACVLFVMAYKGSLGPCDLRSLSSCILRMYCVTSLISGYIAASFHTKFSRIGWEEGICQTEIIFFFPVHVIDFLVTQMIRSSSEPYDSLFIQDTFAIEWMFPCTVLAVIGGFVAVYLRRKKILRPSQCTTAKTGSSSLTAVSKWYVSTVMQVIVGGVVPSLVVFPYIDDILAGLWRLKLCWSFSNLLYPLFLLLVITVMLAVVFTKLAGHDCRWRWRSVFRGGSLAMFAFGYGIYLLSNFNVDERTRLRILGYTACACYALFFILATISFYASSLFHFINIFHRKTVVLL